MLVAVEQNAERHLLMQDEEDQEQRVIEMMYQEVTIAQHPTYERSIEKMPMSLTKAYLFARLPKIQEKEMKELGITSEQDELEREQEEWLATSLAEQAKQESELAELRRLQGEKELEREQEEWLAASLAEQVGTGASILPRTESRGAPPPRSPAAPPPNRPAAPQPCPMALTARRPVALLSCYPPVCQPTAPHWLTGPSPHLGAAGERDRGAPAIDPYRRTAACGQLKLRRPE